MTQVPATGMLRAGMLRAHALLPRLLVVLAFLLFGLPQNQPGGTGAPGIPAAEKPGAQADAILPLQRQFLRAPLPGDTPPDMAVPQGAVPPRPPLQAARRHPAPRLPLPRVADAILPPVRGPPAA